MTRPVVVPDASVLLKWVLPTDDEDDLERALALRDAIVDESIDALLPSLWLFEIANTIGRKRPAEASTLVGLLVDLALPEVKPDARWLDAGLELVVAHGVAFDDASYHATAIRAGGTFVTADRRYESRVRERGHVALLESWRPPAAKTPPPSRAPSP